MSKRKQFPKTLSRLIHDFEENKFLLENALHNLPKHPAHMKTVNHVMRTLIHKGKGNDTAILLYLAKSVGFTLKTIKRTSYRPETFEEEKFETYLRRTCVYIKPSQYTPEQFVRMMANEVEGSHEPNTISEDWAKTNNIRIGGMNPNERQILAIAKKTLRACHDLSRHISTLSKEQLGKYIAKYKEKREEANT